MSMPWDGEQTPMTDEAKRKTGFIESETNERLVYAKDMADIERRLRSAERLLGRALDYIQTGMTDRNDIEAHLAAAKEVDNE
jgi:hypothetical protein